MDSEPSTSAAADRKEVPEMAPFDPTKKKKKKAVVIQEPGDEIVDNMAENTKNLSGPAEKYEESDGAVKYPWVGTDRDYLYEELLGNVFNTLRENNHKLAGGRRISLRPVQVLRVGTRRTAVVNFMVHTKTLNRQLEHVMNYLLAELGTSGSLDGQQRLVVNGRFAANNFEGLLRRYVYDYVRCNGCKSLDTILSKENRLYIIRCEECGSSRSVAPITTGFVAHVGRRSAGA